MPDFGDKSDQGDQVAALGNNSLPARWDIRDTVTLPQILSDMDQRSLGSSAANAIAFCYACMEIIQSNHQIFLPSRLFIYYNGRVINETIDSDDLSASIRDCVKSINTYGVCDEQHWWYDIDQFATRPPRSAYQQSQFARAEIYTGVGIYDYMSEYDILTELKKVLVAKYPFVFAFTVYQSFLSPVVAESGIVPMPDYNDQVLGGHAVCAVGYNDDIRCFIVKNSWGPDWGLNGYFYLPYDYVTSLAYDFWIIQRVSNPTNPEFSPMPTSS